MSQPESDSGLPVDGDPIQVAVRASRPGCLFRLFRQSGVAQLTEIVVVFTSEGFVGTVLSANHGLSLLTDSSAYQG